MIHAFMNMLIHQLSDYIRQVSNNVDEPPVVLGNIAMSEGAGGSEGYMQGRIVMSLVNMMEETTLKNSNHYNNNSSISEIENPPAYMNLYLLFTSNFTSGGNVTDDTDYVNGLRRLSQLVEFFQSKNTFTVQDSPTPETLNNPDFQDLKLTLELHSLSFEQINHLWGSLGGKQMPFVLYKAGILPVKRKLVTGRGAFVKDVKSDSEYI